MRGTISLSPTLAIQEIGPGPFEILSARCLIEGEVAAIAARMARDGVLDAILRALNDMELFYHDRHHNEEADRTFHLSITQATALQSTSSKICGISAAACGS